MSDSNYFAVEVECVGNPEFYDDDDRDPADNSTEPRPYPFNKLPGETAIFNIKCGDLKCCLQYGIFGLEHQKLIKFVNALRDNTECYLGFNPGANQSSYISTKDGMTTFSCHGAGGDCPIDMAINVPNIYCLDAFSKLLPSY
ncbi:putative ORFan [Tupanvirus deep ocean]|uniref:ORFan n=2 Tax=Tupanvirus TaxID=2094720 RepID=A0AC62A9I9_9VIRU|nr:putative ORFan [Tupanvirus deep ocean]QKU34442.1 putative ORFan [Tupanvirus deep ocean]